MSYGDEIMALGQAQRHYRETGRPAFVVDRHGRPRWSDLWAGDPAVRCSRARRVNTAVDTVVNAPGCRPYLKSISMVTGSVFSDWRARDYPARLSLTVAERTFAADVAGDLGSFIVVEPNIAREGCKNKQWGWDRWVGLTARIRDLDPVQLGPAGTRLLPGVRHIETPSFRQACAVLALARFAVLPEGGLHHAAAALQIPAVVIFGGFTQPKTTGYEGHVNLFTGKSACGAWRRCRHCAAAMAAISPETVVEKLNNHVLATG